MFNNQFRLEIYTLNRIYHKKKFFYPLNNLKQYFYLYCYFSKIAYFYNLDKCSIYK